MLLQSLEWGVPMISGMIAMRDRTGIVVWVCAKCRAEAIYRAAQTAAGVASVEACCPVCNRRVGEWHSRDERDQELLAAVHKRHIAA